MDAEEAELRLYSAAAYSTDTSEDLAEWIRVIREAAFDEGWEAGTEGAPVSYSPYRNPYAQH